MPALAPVDRKFPIPPARSSVAHTVWRGLNMQAGISLSATMQFSATTQGHALMPRCCHNQQLACMVLAVRHYCHPAPSAIPTLSASTFLAQLLMLSSLSHLGQMRVWETLCFHLLTASVPPFPSDQVANLSRSSFHFHLS